VDGAESPFWSPDSEWVGFFAPGEGQLKKVAVAGGPARVICRAAIIDVPTWHRNGTILFAQTDVGIFRVPADGGMPTQVTDSTRAAARSITLAHMAARWPAVHLHGDLPRCTWRPGTAHVYVRSVDADDRRC
jgi:hypothetical protein